MFSLLKALLPASAASRPAADTQEDPPAEIPSSGANAFPIALSLQVREGLPVPDWDAVGAWLDSLAPEARNAAWSACERAWLLHLGRALGPAYRLDESPRAALLSTLEPAAAKATLGFMERTGRRVLKLLEGIAVEHEMGKDLLIVFDDEASYYRYVSRYYPGDGEYALSSGMHIDAGCGHFVTVKADLRAIEPVIGHEMIHGALTHLAIPAWLNEGIAVNAERRLAPSCGAGCCSPGAHTRHLKFWTAPRIQQFWSGGSFSIPGDSQELSYDLARILVELLGKDWSAFSRFVLAAQAGDAGEAAAREHLDIDLGALACAFLEREPDPDLRPDPARWPAAGQVPTLPEEINTPAAHP